MTPSVLSIIGVTFVGEDLPRALGIYGVVMGLAAACGQLIGGVLIRPTFWLGLARLLSGQPPVGMAALRWLRGSCPSPVPSAGRASILIGTLLFTATV